jgi:hypothetical protein
MFARWPAALALVSMVATTACGGDDGGVTPPADLMTIAPGPVSGTIDGTPFTLGTRYMNVSGTDLYVDLLPTPAADCTNDETDGDFPFAIFFVPAVAGRRTLGVDQFVTLVPEPSTNLVLSQGVIEIEEIVGLTLRGGLHVWDAEFGELNGRFDGPICYRN